MEDKIMEFIIKNFMNGEGSLCEETNLFESGIVDSMGFILLLSFIEKELGVAVNMSEITIENFDSVRKIADFIRKKLKKEE